MRKRILVAALRLVLLVAVFTWIDARLPVALVFWKQTVPISDGILKAWLWLAPPRNPMEAVQAAVWSVQASAAVIGLAWIYGLARVLWLPLALRQRLQRLEWRTR